MKVFLGGTVNQSTWRKKFIQKLSVDYYNPEKEDWNEEARRQELYERLHCDYCLYTITPKMEGFYSLAEATDDSYKRPERTIFCFLEKDDDSTFNNDQVAALKKTGERILKNGGRWFDSLEEILHFFNSGKAEQSIRELNEKQFTDVLIISPDNAAKIVTQSIAPYIAQCGYKHRITGCEPIEELQNEILKSCSIVLVHSEKTSNDKITDAARFIREFRKNAILISDNLREASFLSLESKLDFSNPASIALSLENLKKHIDTTAARARMHAYILKRAWEWDEGGRRKNQLLVGIERRDAEKWLQENDSQDGALSPTDLQCIYICESREYAEEGRTDVFICHDESDTEVARALYMKFTRKGFTTWTAFTDKEQKDNLETVHHSIASNSHFIFITSKTNWENKQNKALLEYAVSFHKPILLYESSPIPDWESINKPAHTSHIIHGNPDAEAQLFNWLNDGRSYKNMHRDILVKTLQWEQNNHDSQKLLRGFDMELAEKWIENSKTNKYAPTEGMLRYIRKSQTDQTSVFISYARNPSLELASKLHSKLIALNYNVWFDKNDIPLAVDFQEQINIGIEKADYFIFIITPNSIQSKYCKIEIDLARKYNKRIIPLLHHPVEDDEVVDEEIRKINWTDFLETDVPEKFEASVTQLKDVLESGKHLVARHTSLLSRALEWMRRREDHMMLMTLPELVESLAWLEQLTSQADSFLRPSRYHLEYINQSRIHANNAAFDVLICCPKEHQASEHSEEIYYHLIRHNLSVKWFDNKPAAGHDEKNLIAAAGKIVLFINAQGVDADRCRHILSVAKDFNKPILTVLEDDTAAEQLQSRIDTPIQSSLSHKDLLHKNFDPLLKAAISDLNYHNTHKQLLRKALRWERKKNNRAALLRDAELDYFDAWYTTARHAAYGPVALQEEYIKASKAENALIPELMVSVYRDDHSFTGTLCDQLTEFERTTWFCQPYLKGDGHAQLIQQAIESADNFLFVLTDSYLSCPQCQQELKIAQDKHKRIIPITYKPLSEKLPEALKGVNIIDFSSDFQHAFNDLLKTISTDQAYVQQHNEVLRKAIDWEKGNKKDDRLLKGVDAEIADKWLRQAYSEKKNPSPTSLQHQFILESKKAARKQLRRKKIFNRILIALVIGLFISLSLIVRFYINANKAKEAAQKLADSERQLKNQAIALSESRDSARVRATKAMMLAEERFVAEATARQAMERALKNEEKAKKEAELNNLLAEKERDIAQRLFRISEAERLSKLIAQADIACRYDDTWHHLASQALVSYFINVADKGSAYNKDNYLAMYNLVRCEGEVKKQFSISQEGYNDAIAVLPNSNTLLTTHNATVAVRKYSSNEDKLELSSTFSLNAQIESTAISPDAAWVINGTRSGLLTVRNMLSGNTVTIAKLANPVISVSCALKDSGYWIACRTKDMLYIYRFLAHEPAERTDSISLTNSYHKSMMLTTLHNEVHLVAGGFSPEQGHHVMIINLKTGYKKIITGIKNWVTAAAGAKDLIATGHEDGSLNIWSISEDYEIRKLEEFPDNGFFIRQIHFYDNQLMACSQDKILFIPCGNLEFIRQDQMVVLREPGMNSIKGGVLLPPFVFTIEGRDQLVKRTLHPELLAATLCRRGVKPTISDPEALKEILNYSMMSCDLLNHK